MTWLAAVLGIVSLCGRGPYVSIGAPTLLTKWGTRPWEGRTMRKRIIVAGILAITVSAAGLAWGATLAFLTKWGSYGSGQGQFMAPQGIAVGSGDEVFVSDTAHGIQVFSSIGVLLRQFGSGGSRSLAFGPSGRLYIVDVAAGGGGGEGFGGGGWFVERRGGVGSGGG